MLIFLNERSFYRLKQATLIGGGFLALPGLVAAFGFLCAGLVGLGDRSGYREGLATFILMLVTLGGGGSFFWHSFQSLRGQASRPLSLPSTGRLVGIFLLVLGLGSATSARAVASLFFPPTLAVAALLPSLIAIAWFCHDQRNDLQINPQIKTLTWRRTGLALAGGGLFGPPVALIVSALLAALIGALVFNLVEVVSGHLEILFKALAGRNIGAAIVNPGLIYIFIIITFISPVGAELAKPLAVFPWLHRLSRRDVFLLGALSGAGFALMEQLLYAGLGFRFWAGIVFVRALGGAIHPLGAGLMALAWRGVLQRKPDAWQTWLARFGLATGMHALWNGGTLLVIALAGAGYFNQLPPVVDGLGIAAAGATLILLILLGLGALWLGRFVVRQLTIQLTAPATSSAFPSDIATDFASGFASPAEEQETPLSLSLAPTDKMIAVWALACLAVIVPIGIAGLQLVLQ